MITEQELQKLQKLAKLDFSAEQTAEFLPKLASALGMIDLIKEADCSNIEPLRCVYEANQRFREDVVKHNDIAEQLLDNVPAQGKEFAQEVKCFVVPKVVE